MSETFIRRCRMALLLPLALAACAPALNWREVRPARAQDLVALFPCKPDTATRRVQVPGLEGGALEMRVLSCQAGGMQWALSLLDTGSPQRLAQALPALDEALWRNVSAAAPAAAGRQALGAAEVRGADTHAGARRWRLEGQRPAATGSAEQVQVVSWSFARGLSAFQASVWKTKAQGALQVDDPAVEAFAQGFNFPR